MTQYVADSQGIIDEVFRPLNIESWEVLEDNESSRTKVLEFLKALNVEDCDPELEDRISSLASEAAGNIDVIIECVRINDSEDTVGFVWVVEEEQKRFGLVQSNIMLPSTAELKQYPYLNSEGYIYLYENTVKEDKIRKVIHPIATRVVLDSILAELKCRTLTYTYSNDLDEDIENWFIEHDFQNEGNEDLRQYISQIQPHFHPAKITYKCYQPGHEQDVISGFVWVTEDRKVGIILSDEDIDRPYFYQYSFKGRYAYVYEEEFQKNYVIVSPQERNIFDTYGEARYRANRMAENNRNKLFRIAEIKTEILKEDVLDNASDYPYGYGKNIPLISQHRQVPYTLSDVINKFLIRGDLKINDFIIKVVAEDTFFGDADLLIYLDIETWPEHSENQSLYVQWKGWVTVHKTINGKLLWGRWYDEDSEDWFENQCEKNMTIFPGYLEKEYESILYAGTAQYTGSRGDFVEDKIEINLIKELDPKAPEGNQLCRVIDRLISRHAISQMLSEQDVLSGVYDVMEEGDNTKAIYGLDLNEATEITKLTTDRSYSHPSKIIKFDADKGDGYDLVNLYDFEISKDLLTGERDDQDTLDVFAVLFQKEGPVTFENRSDYDPIFRFERGDLVAIIGEEKEFYIFYFNRVDLQKQLTQ